VWCGCCAAAVVLSTAGCSTRWSGHPSVCCGVPCTACCWAYLVMGVCDRGSGRVCMGSMRRWLRGQGCGLCRHGMFAMLLQL
jgi:hypothetical protein